MLLLGTAIRYCLILLLFAAYGYGQAALLLEQPYGLARAIDPTGHSAIYFARICAATPTQLRRCKPGELGSVIARYSGIGRYDWVAIPLIPYFYSVENADQVPAQVNKNMVSRLRRQYHDRHLMYLGSEVDEGSMLRSGWGQLSGTAYDRNLYALRFATTPAQDDRLIARLNTTPNRTHFHLLWNNCANFAAEILDFYFPGEFERRALPDAGIITPRQLSSHLQQRARKHRETQLTLFEIPQIPGYRRSSVQSKSVVESFIVSGDIIPIAVFAPYVAAALGADYLIWGRYPLNLKQAETLAPGSVKQLAGNGDDHQEAESSAKPLQPAAGLPR